MKISNNQKEIVYAQGEGRDLKLDIYHTAVLLLHGTADQMIPFTSSQRMFDALCDHGAAAELHLYPGHTHEFVRLPSMMAPVMAEIALFLKRTVVNPEKYIEENRELNMFA